MGTGRPQKYNRVSCHNKYRLRRLIIQQQLSVKQAARRLNINYSTAKTIMFFFRKSPPLSLNSLQKNNPQPRATVRASYKVIKKYKRIQIISMVQGKVNKGNEIQKKGSNDKIQPIKLEHSF